MSKRSLQVNDNKQLTIMVSSTVYGIEELLERIYTILTEFDYEVWVSHKGTVTVFSTKTAFENCLDAVRKCDLFLSIITPYYGSGKEDRSALSITHQELLLAIELNKPRWVLAHDHVVFARTFLNSLGHKTPQERAKLSLSKSTGIDDLRVIDMYEAAIRHEVEFKDRQGNWVQKFINPAEALLFARAQFQRYQEVEAFLKEHLESTQAVEQRLEGRQ